MVSSSDLPSPGTVSDCSDPSGKEHGRSRRQADGDADGDPAPAAQTAETGETAATGDAVEASGALGATGMVEAIDTVGSMHTLDLDSARDETAETGTVKAPPVKTPVHWVLGAHWLGRWRTPLAIRLWRYGAGSIVAFATSTVVLFVCLTWLHLGAISATIIAFLSGAIPNWVLNRRWAWEKRGREGMMKETTLYVIVSLVALAASSAADKFTAVEATHLDSALAKDVLVTFAYMFSVVLLTGLKYVAYDRIVFVDRPTSRDQVLSTTEQNR
jgi:putative flippase GtrA